MGWFLPEEDSGRTGLSTVKMTPQMYLQLSQQMRNGRTGDYNKEQLQVAFRKYLQNHKGRWKASQVQNLSQLDKFAKEYVASESKRVEEKMKKTPGKTAEAHKNKHQALLKEAGLDHQDVPEYLRAGDTQAQKTEKNIERLEAAVNMMELALMATEPATVVACGVVAMTLETKLTKKLVEVFSEKYQSIAQTKEEKLTMVEGLKQGFSQMNAAQRQQAGPLVHHLQANEKEPEIIEALGDLNKEKPQLFLENIEMTKKPVYLRPAANKIRTPFDLPSLKDGPKPPNFARYDEEVEV